MNVLVTGSSGLIGSEAVVAFGAKGWSVTGVDNNMRKVFFGEAGDTRWRLEALQGSIRRFRHVDIDIRDREKVFDLFESTPFDVVIHCAAQPSHDKAREIPLLDFEVNALGTAILLEATRQHARDAVFIHMSTNKVYGDAPNELRLTELETRYDYLDAEDQRGIDETMRIDRSLHSLFGASKVGADVLAQEYGRYFGMNVGVFRGGCLTGPAHSGVELHGFLSYLVSVAVAGGEYTVYGYKGKQVRDQIHSNDVIRAFEAFIENPRPGEVYNLGGGRQNSASVLEIISLIEDVTGRPLRWGYLDSNRVGDHICYISDLTKLTSHFPDWSITRDLRSIVEEIVESKLVRRSDAR